MRLTCLKCGHQLDVTDKSGHTIGNTAAIACICGASLLPPAVTDTGTVPNNAAAEKTRRNAFRASGIVKYHGGYALAMSILGVLFFPLGVVGALMGTRALIVFRGAAGRYMGRPEAALAIILGLSVFAIEGHYAKGWYGERVAEQRKIFGQGAVQDLKRLRRTQNIYFSNHEEFAHFKQLSFQPAHGTHTLYLGANDIFPAKRDNTRVTDPLPAGLKPIVEGGSFTAVAVAPYPMGPNGMDVWVLSGDGEISAWTNKHK